MQKLRTVCFLLLCVLLWSKAGAQTRAYCDSLIEKGKQAALKQEYVKSVSLFSQARSMAEKNRWYHQQFAATNALGVSYSYMMEYGVALNYYFESYTIALKELGTEYEITALHNIAILHFKEHNYVKAEEYYKKVYAGCKKVKDYSQLGIVAYNLGLLYDQMDNPQEAQKYLAESLSLAKDTLQALNIEIELANNDLLLGNVKQAREKAEMLYTNTKKSSLYDEKAFLLRIIARSYIQEGNYIKAAENANKIFSESPNLENKLKTFDLLSNIYFKLGSLEMTAKFKDSVIAAERKLQEIKNGQLYESNKVKFEVQNYKNEIKANEEKIIAERKFFYSALAICIAVIIIIVLVFRQKSLVAQKKRQAVALELEKEKNDNLVLEKQMREKESNALLEQERLKNEIEARNRKLSAKALYFSERNQFIEEIITSLAKRPKLTKDKYFANQVRALKNHLKTDKEWGDFIAHFEEVNNGFLERLKTLHPTLTTNDIRFIAYIYMNLNVKEIAAILNITPDACRKRKERLAAKMGLPENTNIYSYISSL